MRETSGQTTEIEPTGMSPANEMDNGLLRRGDGKLSIVGLGGSAGSIVALQEFFAAMPVDSGLAFVIILHLSPDHESTLAEMFQRSTAMPVVAATDGTTVEPNSVYVIPPGKFLASIDGHLGLTDAQETYGKRVAVDYFFRTLAETHGAHALAVVLSGMGGDGALGLKRVKELGGLTIAQDPDESEHPDMPRSAIATGMVDWVLGVKEMPAKLLAYVRQRAELTLPDEDGPHPVETAELTPNDHEAALRDVLAFLNTRTGRDFSYYKRATILRRIARRMQVNGLSDLPSYLVYMRTHSGEPGALLQDLLISVTNFFPDPASFAALERTIPELFKGKGPGDTVRVWVAGCATGEEAYSIAILLSEHAATLVGPPQLQVFATDLHEEVIREARAGLYPETISADVSEERLRHFFIHEPGGYRVRRAVRELVLFAPHDLLKDSPFSRLDLVSCRNLLIYLKRDAQSRAFDIFHFALRPGGRLFLGTSEAVDDGNPLFAVLDKKQRLYTKRPAPQRLIAVPTGPGTLARARALQERERERPTVPVSVTVASVQGGLGQLVPLDNGLPPGELHYRLIERFSPPSILVNSIHEIVHLSESAGRFLQIAGGEPTRNLLSMVHPMLRVELRAALYAAAQTHIVVAVADVPVEMGGVRCLVDIRVTPAGELAPDFLLVVFEQHPAEGATALAAPRSADADQAALHLERELVATKAHLRDTIEQSGISTEELKASNEELQAMNEEMHSATEELETSREELQSINEELTTVNDELKINVDRLARSNDDLQNLMAATEIATVFLDRDLRVQRFTPSAKTLFNFISTDLGRPLSDLSRQLDYPELVDDAERALALLQPAQREVRAGEQWYSARTLPYRTADDHIAGVVLSFLDITVLKNAEAGLLEADRRKDEFLAVLAHELRNPLAPISSGLQVIRMAGVDGTIEQARSMMERQLRQMTRLVDDLLDVSRLTTGKLELRMERLQIRDVIAAALETSKPAIEQQGHAISVAMPDAPIFLDGDPVRLAQVVSNLLTNSAKYTHRGGHIRVSVSSDDATAVVTVADDGIGIPANMLDKVFGMFTQVDRTLEKATGGLGIGLSLAKGVVERHGGTMEAFSEGEGKGTEFTVRLPSAISATSAVSESVPSGGEMNGVEPTVSRRILVVDDNVDAADILRDLLEMMGNEVRTAYDGESGVEAAKAFKAEIVLCDIGMPKMNGYDTARSIRGQEWGKNIVLVALTGWGQKEDLKKSVDAGFDHHLVKPVELSDLMALLAGLQPQAK